MLGYPSTIPGEQGKRRSKRTNLDVPETRKKISVILTKTTEGLSLFDLSVYFVASFGKDYDKEIWGSTKFADALHTNVLEQITNFTLAAIISDDLGGVDGHS